MRNVVFASSIEDPMGSYTFMTGSVVLGHCDHAHLISWFSVWMFDCSRACPPFLIILYPSWPRLLMMLSTFFFLNVFISADSFPTPHHHQKNSVFFLTFSCTMLTLSSGSLTTLFGSWVEFIYLCACSYHL